MTLAPLPFARIFTAALGGACLRLRRLAVVVDLDAMHQTGPVILLIARKRLNRDAVLELVDADQACLGGR